MKPFDRILTAITVLGLGLTASACGPQKVDKNKMRGTSTTLAQQSDSFDDNGTYLCRLEYSYASSLGGSADTTDFVVAWGLKRSVQKREILSDCTNSSLRPNTAAQACVQNIEKAQCVHSSLLPNMSQTSSGGLTKCTLEYQFRYNGQTYGGITEKIESLEASVADAVKQAVDQCMSRTGGALDGCTSALVSGGLSCARR